MNTATAKKIHQHLRARQGEMVQMLARCAEMESPSADPAAQQPLFELFTGELQKLGFRCKQIKGKKSGGQLLATSESFRETMRRQLLLGHCDTVWPKGTLTKMPVEFREGRVYGPGVYDMKGGLVQAVFALSALAELGLKPEVSPVVFINSDEEIGSFESAETIRRLASVVDRAMVMEPSLGPEGHLKTARKGVGRFVVKVSGRAAHAGLDPEKGISAILELSHVIQTLFALNDPDGGTTVNVGTIDGGMRPNVIAPESRAEVDVRVRTQQDADAIEQAIYAIQPSVPGTELHITGKVGRPPLEPTPRNRLLWQRAVEASRALGIELGEAAAGGGSDGNWTSLYTSTLDGLGAVGDGAHALTEHVVEDKMPERSALLACLIMSEAIAADSDDQQEDQHAVGWNEIESLFDVN